MTKPAIWVAHSVWRAQERAERERLIPEETALALTYNGAAYAVMMATPRDLADFAVGFSLTEGIVAAPQDINQFDIVEQEIGIELRLWLAAPRAAALDQRRRHMAGPTGCGLCGIESLAQAMRPVPRVTDGARFRPAEILQALDAVAFRQDLNRQTRAVHAAAFWRSTSGLVAVREDVGRHNALDKLVGALARERIAGAPGMIVLTSRVSVEMVQKTAAFGAPVVVAMSAPTGLAVRTAQAAGITLVAVARSDGFEIFSHPERIAMEAQAEAAQEVVDNVA